MPFKASLPHSTLPTSWGIFGKLVKHWLFQVKNILKWKTGIMCRICCWFYVYLICPVVILSVLGLKTAELCHQPRDHCGLTGKTLISCQSFSSRTMKSFSRMGMVSELLTQTVFEQTCKKCKFYCKNVAFWDYVFLFVFLFRPEARYADTTDH